MFDVGVGGWCVWVCVCVERERGREERDRWRHIRQIRGGETDRVGGQTDRRIRGRLWKKKGGSLSVD